uniref:Preprotein-translocase subunit g n=1 Tax=Pleonosporium borreri TaxID=2575635 RepID=A0A4D6WXJ1_9FLOR|nr:Preprotein-translocase subunit g [Pleonosporium borreri]
MVKLFWYLISLMTIFLILMYTPSNSKNTLINSNYLLNFSSNQQALIKVIIVNIILFILLIIFAIK